MPILACARCGAALTTACNCPPEIRRDAGWVFADEVITLRHPERSSTPPTAAPAGAVDAQRGASS